MRYRCLTRSVVTGAVLLASLPAWSAQPKEKSGPLSEKEFFNPKLAISTSNLPIDELKSGLANSAALDGFASKYSASQMFADPRSDTPTGVILSVPLIPGAGKGNRLTPADVGRKLGRAVPEVSPAVLADLVEQFIGENRAALAVEVSQMGKTTVTQVTDNLYHVSIPQQVDGIPVRYARLAATVKQGNLILWGSEVWRTVRTDTTPRVGADPAVTLGFEYLGGRKPEDTLWKNPTLEIIPYAPPEHQKGEAFAGPVGEGLEHILVWAFGFNRPSDDGDWEALVDAHTGEILAFQDTRHYQSEKRKITGGVYPLTNTEICPSTEFCGEMQPGYPMPFANTDQPAPNDLTNSAGLFDWDGGTVTTTLNGRHVRISDVCGAVSESSVTGDIDLEGANGDHNCTVPAGHSAGDTASSRSAFYEVNKLGEMARGWLPTNNWLLGGLGATPTNVNINNACNAFYSLGPRSINFYKSGVSGASTCRNTGEIAGVFDHEWGHGMDHNDAGAALSNSSEAYADIVANLRLQVSCVGHGFRSALTNPVCGFTSDGNGPNANEAQVGAPHCNLDCSGVRDADWGRHADGIPDTPQNFVCPQCGGGGGPCGRQVHCSAAPVRQAAWDFVARDLQSAPFSFDTNTAFIIGNKVFYQGSGNVGLWHACNCTAGTSNGCGATNGYMQWLAADDDNGDLTDGTPHMTALFNAFDRHNIACPTPAPQNGGCAGAPTTAPTVTMTPGNNQVALSWTEVSEAVKYWVFRTEGHAGCDFGKTLIATVDAPATSYTDTEVANGRQYCYSVMAVGTSDACFGPASACSCVTPQPGTPDFTVSANPAFLEIPRNFSGTSTVTVTSVNGFEGAVTLSCEGQQPGVTCSFDPNPVMPPVNSSTTSLLTISVAADVPLGDAQVTVKGTDAAGRMRTFTIDYRVIGNGTP